MADVVYAEDASLATDAEFMEWMHELEVVMNTFGAEHEGHPYGGTLIKTTGLKCWHQYFADGYSPRDAFNEDRTYWD